MSYKIVVDSCCDLTAEMKEWSNLTVVPLTLQIGDYIIQDDENFDQEDFIQRMLSSSELAKSACPSPDAFAAACEGDEDEVYIITITDKLSGCYNSAVQGVTLYKEDHPDSTKKIHVINSLATSGLETILAYKIKELADNGTDFDEIVKTVEEFCVKDCFLYFYLESFDALKGNGRLFNLGAKVIEALRVKLICKRTDYGNITLAGKDLSETRIIQKLAAFVQRETEGADLTDKTAIVSYVCCKEKAEAIVKAIKEKTGYENVIALKASGLNSLYASNNGIIVSFSK
ncbi:MAG: DegV family EDD domain-containing protein [Eubacterium sp.]|nr:DegV family EDD domain-containing protein [Eubacterium sp.]